jgi:hypothetical protein
LGGGFLGAAFFAALPATGRRADRNSGLISRDPGIAACTSPSVANGPWMSCWPNSFACSESTRNQP